MGTRIRRLREAKGLTQPALAELCKCTKSAVSQWEDGSTSSIKLPQLTRLLRVLDTDLNFLVYGVDRKPPDGWGTSQEQRRDSLRRSDRGG